MNTRRTPTPTPTPPLRIGILGCANIAKQFTKIQRLHRPLVSRFAQTRANCKRRLQPAAFVRR